MVSCKTRSGVTMTEVLVVLAIVGIVAAITVPATLRAKLGAKITDDRLRLHQCQMAVAIYCADNEGRGIGRFSLPSLVVIGTEQKLHKSFYGATRETWTSACGWHPTSLTPQFIYFDADDEAARRRRDRFGEHSILLSDANCNDSDVDLRAQFTTKRGLGVLIDGTLVQRFHAGDVSTWEFWEEGP